MSDESTRATLAEIDEPKIGDPHLLAYVGPPSWYDVMGATQFRLLCALGLRARHTLLDFGCGSLRAGRLFLAYLDPGHYHGIEPNHWLVKSAIESHLGEDFIRLRQPRFDENEEFRVPFEARFDYILAQSIFSHTAIDLTRRAIGNLSRALKDDGLIVATFVLGRRDPEEAGWVYPGCVRFRPRTIERIADEAGLVSARLPWYHPGKQTWYVMAPKANPHRLPTPAHRRYLKGVVLNDPEFAECTMSPLSRGWRGLRSVIGPMLPEAARRRLRGLVKS